MGRYILVTAGGGEVVGAGDHNTDRCGLRPMGGSGWGGEVVVASIGHDKVENRISMGRETYYLFKIEVVGD